MAIEQQTQSNIESGKSFDTSSVLHIRLDTSYVLERVDIYLTGKTRSIIFDEAGKAYVKEEVITNPKANKKGIHAIKNFVENIINPSVVQGNFDEHLFETHTDFIHDSLLTNLMVNLYEWEIDQHDYEQMVDNIMALIIPYLSRLKDNKERDSYAQSLKSEQTSNVIQSKSKIFGGG
jgi:hypothetical protein